jgi:hypothetical protein
MSVREMQIGTISKEDELVRFIKMKTLPQTTSLVGFYLTDIFTQVENGVCVRPLFYKNKNSNQPNCPSTAFYLKREYYAAIKKKEHVLFVLKRKDFPGTLCNEKSRCRRLFIGVISFEKHINLFMYRAYIFLYIIYV